MLKYHRDPSLTHSILYSNQFFLGVSLCIAHTLRVFLKKKKRKWVKSNMGNCWFFLHRTTKGVYANYAYHVVFLHTRSKRVREQCSMCKKGRSMITVISSGKLHSCNHVVTVFSRWVSESSQVKSQHNSNNPYIFQRVDHAGWFLLSGYTTEWVNDVAVEFFISYQKALLLFLTSKRKKSLPCKQVCI